MTVQQLIDKALVLIGVIAPGETPATEERNDAFDALNNLVANWSAQQLPLFSVQLDTVTLTGAASYTLASRPMRIKSAQVLAANGTAQAPALIDAVGWAGVSDKTRTGVFAEVLYCDYGYPSAVVTLSPRPGAGTLEIYSYKQLTEFASLAEVIDLPPGYERALRYALAIDLAPEYGRTVTPEIAGSAQEAKNAIAQLNAIVLGEMQPGPTAATKQAA